MTTAFFKRIFDRFFSLFMPIPKRDRAAVREYCRKDTLDKARMIHFFVLFTHLATLAAVSRLFGGKKHVVLSPLDWWYFFITCDVVILSLITIILLYKLKDNPAYQRKLEILFFCSMVFFMLATGFLTSYEYYSAAQYFRYILAGMAVSLLLSYSTLEGVVILIPGYIVFLAGNALLTAYNPPVYTELGADAFAALRQFPTGANIIGYVLVCVGIFAVNSKRSYSDFQKTQHIMSYQKELEQLNQRLNGANEQLLAISTIDPLTKLNNRRALDEYIADIWPGCKDKEVFLAIMMFDIDFFKYYNDSFGHQAGDEGLRTTANVIKRNFAHTGGMLARYGGEEFIVVIPYAEESAVISIAESIRAQIEALRIANPTPSNAGNILTISIGVFMGSAKGIDSMEEGIRIADEALYRAKSKGRNTVVIETIFRNGSRASKL